MFENFSACLLLSKLPCKKLPSRLRGSDVQSSRRHQLLSPREEKNRKLTWSPASKMPSSLKTGSLRFPFFRCYKQACTDLGRVNHFAQRKIKEKDYDAKREKRLLAVSRQTPPPLLAKHPPHRMGCFAGYIVVASVRSSPLGACSCLLGCAFWGDSILNLPLALSGGRRSHEVLYLVFPAERTGRMKMEA